LLSLSLSLFFFLSIYLRTIVNHVRNRVISPHDQCQRETSFFDASLDLDTLNAQLGDLNMLGMGQVHSTSSSGAAGGGAASRRGILSGNVKEFRYQDDDDDDNDDEAEY
jgi:hypothetical protein